MLERNESGADVPFLRNILFGLIFATVCSGIVIANSLSSLIASELAAGQQLTLLSAFQHMPAFVLAP